MRTFLFYSFIGAMGVLIIMNAKNFSTAAGAVSGPFLSWEKTLTGAGY